MPRSSEIQVLLGILHCPWQTYMGVSEGREEEGRGRRTLYPTPLHPPQASDHSSQAELLSEFRFSLCLNSLSALPLLAHVGLKPPALASPGCLTSLWFCERCPHHCKWSPSGIFLQLPTLSTLTAVYWCTYPQ